MEAAAIVIQSHYRGYITRKRNKEIDLKFASLVAEIAPNKLLEFWDLESLSRRRIKSVNLTDTDNKSESEIELEEEIEIKKELIEEHKPVEIEKVESEKPNAFEQLGLKTSEARKSIGTILTEAGFKARTIERGDLVDKRRQLLSDLWHYQSAILERRQTHHG